MPVTRHTLRLVRDLRRQIGAEVDSAVRTLTGDWVAAWDDLTPAWSVAVDELADAAVRLERWPRPGELLRLDRVNTAMSSTVAALDKLGERTETVTADGADRLIHLDAEAEARIIASQAPATEQPALAARVSGQVGAVESLREMWAESARDDVRLLINARVHRQAIGLITDRTREQIHSDTLPLAPAAVESMRRELVRGVRVGDNPRAAARRMLATVEGEFNGGLTRAMTIARTEMLDAYRATAREVHTANRDVVRGWQWLSALDRRACPSCWSMHGRTFPVETPGPEDHQQGRCTRLPVLTSWAELGISAPEPDSAMPDGQAVFRALPRAAQIQVMGQQRRDLWQSGRIDWTDLATRRDTAGWRPSYAPTPLRTLTRHATRASATPPKSAPQTVAAPLSGPAARDAAPASLVRRGVAGTPQQLTAAQRRALLRYKGASYTAISGVLRSPGGLGAVADLPAYREVRATVEAIDTLMARSPLRADVVVDRGIQDGAGVFGPAWGRSMVGAEWTEGSYVSTTTNPRLAALFAGQSGGAVLRILVPRGTGAVELSEQRHEGELLLQRGLRMRVVQDTGPGTRPRRITVEVTA